MKQIIISLISLFIISIGGQAQTISVEDNVEALSSGETVSVKLHVAGVTAMSSVHFEVLLPSEFNIVNGSIGATSEWAASYSNDGGVVSAMSSSDNAFTGDGDIAIIPIVVPDGTSIGSYPVIITNVRINGESFETTAGFNIVVVDVHSITLDEASTDNPVAALGVNVTVKRTIKANEWSTLCLPFDLTATQVKEFFGEDVQLAYFTGYDVEKDGNRVLAITINFDDYDWSEGFYANYPYLIKTSKDITEFSLTTDITPDVVQESFSTGMGSNKKTGKFIGTYQAMTVVPENSLFLSDNKFWYSAGLTKMKAFRAYFTLSDVLTEKELSAARILMVFNDGETTGIGDALRLMNNGRVNSEESASAVYNLKGQRVAQPSKGLYIKDGRKVVVK